MDLNIESMDGKVREVLQGLVHSIRSLVAENKATNACVEAMKVNLTALQGNVVRGNITEPTPYIQTKNFRRAFSSLTRNKGESLLTLSVRVSELAKQAYPAFREIEFKELVKNKFLEVIPTALEDYLEFAFDKVDMGKVTLAKIVEFAEGCEKHISEIIKNETIKPAIMIETKLASTLENVTSLRPNGGAILKLKCNLCNRFGHTNKTCVSSNVNVSLINSNKVDNRVNKSNRSISNRRCYSCKDFGHLAHACKKGPNHNNLPGNVPHYYLSTNKCCGCGEDLTIDFHVWDDCPAVIYKRQIDMVYNLGMRQDTINIHQNYNIKPKADCITKTIPNFNLDDNLINEAERYADEIEPRATHIKETFSDFNLNNSEVNKTVSECEDQYNKTIVIADLFRDNKATEVDHLFIDTEPKAEIVKLTENDIIIQLNENIEFIVPNNNTEPINDNVIVKLPDIELVQPENIRINLEKSLIKPKASHDFNLKCKEDSESNILGNNIGPKAENFKQTEAIVSVKLDEVCKINNTNNNIKPPTSIIVESDKGKVKPKAVKVVKDIFKSDIFCNKKGKVNNKNSNLQPKATGIVETRSKSHSNKNVNLNCSELVIKPKASDVNNKSKLIVNDNKKVKLDDKNIKLKPKAKNVHINEISKVKTTYDRVEPKAESWEDILAEFNLQCDKDNMIKITNDKVKPKAVDVDKDNSKSNISAGQIVKVNYESSNVKPRAKEFEEEEDNISRQLDVSENIEYNESPFTLGDEGPFTLDDEGPFTMFDDGTFALY
ncbi:unnamed protein product [Rotaria magnacalcarata]|uniref:CCHC-type domain-containing protein n=1 Tax=Rotaria magnacalcarata TaxID=392030 RepID=A0A819S405_9BILA|nr:unnamed protein product [Rotaria magnacalcarata]CAF4050834.1 unnamed protein product [Rotaria magnacalcarata]